MDYRKPCPYYTNLDEHSPSVKGIFSRLRRTDMPLTSAYGFARVPSGFMELPTTLMLRRQPGCFGSVHNGDSGDKLLSLSLGLGNHTVILPGEDTRQAGAGGNLQAEISSESQTMRTGKPDDNAHAYRIGFVRVHNRRAGKNAECSSNCMATSCFGTQRESRRTRGNACQGKEAHHHAITLCPVLPY